MTSSVLCPYCSKNRSDSRDNVFPDFLGGHARIEACKRCNNTFGHTIEAAASEHLKKLMFELRRSGMPAPTRTKWKGVKLDDRHGLYHIDQDLNAVAASPIIERDVTGKIVRATGSKRQVNQIKKALEKRGRQGVIGALNSAPSGLRLSRVTFPLDDDIKRMCVKMSVATLRRMRIAFAPGVATREYLLSGTVKGISPVRIAVGDYPELDAMRPRAGHLIYVRANPGERRAYSVVQLFSALQFYCELDNEYTGANLAVVATHDPVTHKESFRAVAPIDYPVPPRHLPISFADAIGRLLEKLRLELVELYGDQAPEFLSPAT